MKQHEYYELPHLITEIEKWSKKYEFSFQFWGDYKNSVWIYKDGVELFSSGGCRSMVEVMTDAMNYVYKVNRTPLKDRVTN